MLRITKTLLLYIFFFSIFNRTLKSASLARPFGKNKNHEFYLEFVNLFYADVGLYFSMTKEPIPVLEQDQEKEIYRYLIKHFFLPRFLVLEVGVYPFPLLGAGLRAWTKKFYPGATIGDANIIQSMTYSVDFPEPYSVSLFLGNIVKFKKEKRKVSGRGYTGFLLSYGNFHIKENIIFPDQWLESEMKIKGEYKSKERRMTWSFRLGGRIHFHDLVREVLYLALYRDRTDYEYRKFNIFRNTLANLRMDFLIDTEDKEFLPMRLTLQLGKKWLIRLGRKKPDKEKKRLILGLTMGFKWDFNSLYKGALNTDFEKNDFTLLVSPIVEF